MKKENKDLIYSILFVISIFLIAFIIIIVAIIPFSNAIDCSIISCDSSYYNKFDKSNPTFNGSMAADSEDVNINGGGWYSIATIYMPHYKSSIYNTSPVAISMNESASDPYLKYDFVNPTSFNAMCFDVYFQTLAPVGADFAFQVSGDSAGGAYYFKQAGTKCDVDVSGSLCYTCGSSSLYDDFNSKMSTNNWYTFCHYWNGSNMQMSIFNGTTNIENVSRSDCATLNNNLFTSYTWQSQPEDAIASTYVIDNFRTFNGTMGTQGIPLNSALNNGIKSCWNMNTWNDSYNSTNNLQKYGTGLIENQTDCVTGTNCIYLGGNAGLGTDLGVQLGANWTVSFWLKQNTSTDAYALTGKNTFETWNALFDFYSDNNIYARVGTYAWNWAPSGGFNYGSWVHWVMITNGTNVKTYKNGILSNDNTNAGYANGNWNFTRIGCGANYDCSGGATMIGKYDDIMFWNRPLNTTEIATVYNGGSSISCPIISSSTSSDTIPPTINSISIKNITNAVNITTNITDNIAISTVIAQIQIPSGTKTNYTMVLLNGDIYNLSYKQQETGIFNLTIFVNDTSNNKNNASTIFYATLSKPSIPTILSPINNSIYKNLNITFYSTTTDNSTISYKIYINNTLNITTNKNITYWNASEGYYSLKISANNSIGESDNSSIIYFYFDNSAPVFSGQTYNNTYPKKNENVNFSIIINDINPGTYKFFWNASGSFVNDTLGTIIYSYQENADSYSYAGYECTASGHSSSLLYDGDWSTTTYPNSFSSECGAFMNYTKLIDSIGVIWQVGDGDGRYNITLPSECINSTIQLKGGALLGGGWNAYSEWYCYNYSSNNFVKLLEHYNSNILVGANEEGIYWLINNTNYTSGNRVSINKTITNNHNSNICWGYWANDLLNQSATSSLYCFDVQNTPPTIPTVAIPTDNYIYSYYQNKLITFLSTDVDGESITYYGYINNSLNFTTVSNNIINWNGSSGYYNLKISASDGYNFSNNISINFYVNTPPTNINASIIPEISYNNDTLYGYSYIQDNDNNNLNITYNWYRNNILIKTGVNDSSLLSNINNIINTLDKGYLYVYDNFIFSYISNDGHDNSTWINSTVNIIQNRPFINVSIVYPLNGIQVRNNISFNYTAYDNDNGINCTIQFNNTILPQQTQFNKTNNIIYSFNSNFTETENDYKYYINCTANGQNSTRTISDINTIYLHIIPVHFLELKDNSITTFPQYPQIDDIITMNATLYDEHNISTCKLEMNDTGSWENKTTYIINQENYLLNTEYTIHNYSTANKSNIGWKIWCNDSVGNIDESNISVFKVYDITLPILFINTSLFNFQNNSIVSSKLYNLTYNFSAFDYNLFQVEVNFSCDINGTIYFWQILDYNSSLLIKTDTININNLSPQKCRWYASASDDHTTKEEGNYIVNDINNGKEFITTQGNKIKFYSAEMTEDEVRFAQESKNENERLIIVAQNSINNVDDIQMDNIELEEKISGEKNIMPEISRTELIRQEIATPSKQGKIIDESITDINDIKRKDRYNIEFKFSEAKTERKFIYEADSDTYYRPNSKYPAHFVTWKKGAKQGNWFDMKEENLTNEDITVIPLGDNKYEIYISSDIPLDKYYFESIGGTNIYNYSFDMYIGSAIYVNTSNIYDNTTFNNFSVQITPITGNISGNQTLLSFEGQNGWIVNITNGTYNLLFIDNNYRFFNQTSFINITTDIYTSKVYNTYQSVVFVYVKNLKDISLANFTIQMNNTNSSKVEIKNSSDNYYVYFEQNASNYNIQAFAINYNNLSLNFSIGYQQNITLLLNLSVIAKFFLIDEKTLVPFNISSADSVQFLLYCPDNTQTFIINTTNFTTLIDCNYRKFTFFVDYTLKGYDTYSRTLIIEPENIINANIYLMDLTHTTAIYNDFRIDDLLNTYENPRIYIYKLISNTQEMIISDYVDIQKKVSAYLIKNNEYIVDIKSDNMPDFIVGSYTADLAGENLLRVYDIAISPGEGQVSWSNDVTATSWFNSSTNTIYADYTDLKSGTSDATFKVYLGTSINGTLLYTYTATTPNDFSVIYVNPSLENQTVTAIFDVNHEEAGHQVFGKIVNTYTQIRLAIINQVGQQFINWFILLFLGLIAIMATIRTANIVSLIVVILAAIFVVFGWFQLSTNMMIASALLAVAGLVAFISFMKGESN